MVPCFEVTALARSVQSNRCSNSAGWGFESPRFQCVWHDNIIPDKSKVTVGGTFENYHFCFTV